VMAAPSAVIPPPQHVSVRSVASALPSNVDVAAI
jgi:hypothetical protein